MKWHESHGPLRKHRMKGAWKRLSDAELATIDAQAKRGEPPHRHGTDYPRRKTA